jgi:hypothetical protein
MFEEIVYFAYNVSIGFLWIAAAWGIGKAASYAIEALHSVAAK